MVDVFCSKCGAELSVAFKAVELTSWGTLRSLGMGAAKRVRLPLNRWVSDGAHGFTAAKTMAGVRQVIQFAQERKRKSRPNRTAIALILGEGVIHENKWRITFRRIKLLTVLERSKPSEAVLRNTTAEPRST